MVRLGSGLVSATLGSGWMCNIIGRLLIIQLEDVRMAAHGTEK